MRHIGSCYQSSAADANDKHPVEWTNELTQRFLQEHLSALREVAALDVRPLVACIEQCEQIAAPFYRIGEIQALRDVGNLGLGGVA